MQPRSTSYKAPAARVGLRAICEMKPDERPGHEVLREFWDRITALAKAYTRCTKEEVEQSESITTESIDLFHEFGPQLWRRPEPGKQRPWLYNAGEGWNGVLYESDIFFDNIDDQEFLRSTTIDLIRRKINTSVKGRKSSARPQYRPSTCGEEPPAPPIKCPANASGKNYHRDAASFAEYGICWFDMKDDKIGHNGGPSFEEVVVGFYDRTDGGTKTDRVEPTVFDVDVKTNPIPAECLSCITEDRAYLLQITWSRFNEGEMRKRVPTYTARLGNREVFALLRPVSSEDQDRVPTQYPLWQFWKIGGGYTESVFLAELTAHEQRSIAEEMRRQQRRSGPLRRVRRLTLKASTPADFPAQSQGKKRARGSAAGESGANLLSDCTARDEDDDVPLGETKKRMTCSPSDEGQTTGRLGGHDGQDIAEIMHGRSTGDTTTRDLVPRKDDLDSFRKPVTTVPTDPQYISDQDWNKALSKAESLDATIRKSGRQKLRRHSHAGRVQETDEGVLAATPCKRCASSRKSFLCRVYKDPSSTRVTSCGYCASRGSSGCRAVAPDGQTLAVQEELASPVPLSQLLGSAARCTPLEASSSRMSTLSPSLAGTDLGTEPETLQLDRMQPLQTIAAAATKLEASASSRSSTTAPTLLDKGKETKQQAEQQTQAPPTQASARQGPFAEPQFDQLQFAQVQTAQVQSASAHSTQAQSAQSSIPTAQLKEVHFAQSLPAQPVQLQSARSPAPQAQNNVQTAESCPAQPTEAHSTRTPPAQGQSNQMTTAPSISVQPTQAHPAQPTALQTQLNEVQPAPPTQAQPVQLQPIPTQLAESMHAPPPPTPPFRFTLCLKSFILKGTKFISLTDAMTVEEVFASLQKNLDRPFGGKEILTFFVNIPGDDDAEELEPYRIDKGDAEDGWEVVVGMVKERRLRKLSGVVEAE
ncbi:hypothetical protein TI39_contig4195g00007 [Zymoseptoria brevis]|uniref:Uncharacterized protein n=1 Tax=Zymoseptoria brevis TaxID=1047168 RepID=A0A0F4GBR9_9PEZI|nr:hypothetical protein TI39_contig4195g00007 [Zymoseptoria brevis]